MSDLYHYIGGDLQWSATGDVLFVDGAVMGQQRVLRRLLSNAGDLANEIPADYLWHPDYGAGLPKKVGATLDMPGIKALIRAHLFRESRVARQPEPEIIVTAIASGVSVRIRYADAVTKDWIPLSFDINQ